MSKDTPKLTPKQTLFVEEYLIDLNATAAAKRAGYSPKTAESIGYENLRKPQIQAVIQEKRKKISEKLEISAAIVVQEQVNLGMYNINDYYNDDGTAKQLHELTRNQLAAVKSFKRGEIKVVDGEEEITVFIITDYFFHNKDKALEALSKHTGIYEIDNTQKGNADLMTLSQAATVLVDSIRGTTGLPEPRKKK